MFQSKLFISTSIPPNLCFFAISLIAATNIHLLAKFSHALCMDEVCALLKFQMAPFFPFFFLQSQLYPHLIHQKALLGFTLKTYPCLITSAHFLKHHTLLKYHLLCGLQKLTHNWSLCCYSHHATIYSLHSHQGAL